MLVNETYFCISGYLVYEKTEIDLKDKNQIFD